jgi:hypothetical protein
MAAAIRVDVDASAAYDVEQIIPVRRAQFRIEFGEGDDITLIIHAYYP